MPRVRRALRVALGAAHDGVDIPVTGADPEPHQVKLLRWRRRARRRGYPRRCR